MAEQGSRVEEPNHQDTPARPRGIRETAAASLPGHAVASLGARLSDGLRDTATVLPLVLIAAFVTRFAWLDLPHGSLIFDEAYYVQAARTLLGWPVPAGAHYAGSLAGIDPNSEHPPLGKVLMALSMLAFGDNGFGWRVPSLVAGMIALFAMVAIVRAGRESAWFGILVVALLGFDNLTLVHGRIGTLDMLVLAPMLVGSWLALRERWALAGIAMAVAILVKITALYGVAAVLLLYLLEGGGRWWRLRRIPLRDLRAPVVFLGVFAVVGLAGLAALDARFTAYASPIDHLSHMVSYGANLAAPVAQTAHCPANDSLPWQWVFNDCQIPYLRVDVTVRSGSQVLSSRPSIDFRGAMNPILVGLMPISALFAAWYAWSSGSRVARWAVAWGAANFLPFIALAVVSKRVMYLYYMLPVMPAVAVAVALLLLRGGLPKLVRWGLIAAFVVGFLAYYPFRQIP